MRLTLSGVGRVRSIQRGLPGFEAPVSFFADLRVDEGRVLGIERTEVQAVVP
jgi:hypothetical protein